MPILNNGYTYRPPLVSRDNVFLLSMPVSGSWFKDEAAHRCPVRELGYFLYNYALVAQWIEQHGSNLSVAGSNPAQGVSME